MALHRDIEELKDETNPPPSVGQTVWVITDDLDVKETTVVGTKLCKIKGYEGELEIQTQYDLPMFWRWSRNVHISRADAVTIAIRALTTKREAIHAQICGLQEQLAACLLLE